MVEPTPVDGSDPLNNYRIIRSELEHYSPELGTRPEIVAVTKCELPDADEVRAKLASETGRAVLAISAVTGQNLDQLLWEIDRLLKAQ